MLNVILIDDEMFILKSIKHSIAWDTMNLQVVGTFTNSLEALEYIKANPVDLVITDIRMPGISGLDLCDYVFHNHPDTQLIIISGYADFTYAQKAIRYNVLGYCIKPLDYSELTTLLHKAVKKVAHTTQSSYDVLDALHTKDIPTLENYFYTHHLNPDHFYMLVSIGGSKPLEFPQDTCTAIKFGVNKYIYLSNLPFELSSFSVPKLQALHIKGIGQYPTACTLNQSKDCMRETITMAYQYFFTGHYSICTRTATPKQADIISQLNKTLVTRNTKKIREFVCSLKQQPTELLTLPTALKIWNMVITYITGYMLIEIPDYSIYSTEELPEQFATFSEMLLTLDKLLSQENTLTDFSTSHNNTLIYILQFIRNNYTSNISLADIAANFHLNQSYISQLFRKELGTTYTDYVCQLRIEHAKKLLVETDLSLSAISEQIGYNDYFYFLKSFKKYVGTSPGKYRSQDA